MPAGSAGVRRIGPVRVGAGGSRQACARGAHHDGPLKYLSLLRWEPRRWHLAPAAPAQGICLPDLREISRRALGHSGQSSCADYGVQCPATADYSDGAGMTWSIGFDEKWQRDIGYGVPAYCDHPDCLEEIDRGLSFVCGGEPYGGDRGCGLYFCEAHRIMHARLPMLCARCSKRQKPFPATPDHPDWIKHKLTDASWTPWRDENPEAVKAMQERI